MVIWLLGISGAGKTTLGKELHTIFNQNNIKSFIIDGDIVRDFYNNDLGYSKSDRISNIKRIMLSAYVLEQNGIIPIVCNISPFEFLRDFARDKFDKYVEVYLKREIQDIVDKYDLGIELLLLSEPFYCSKCSQIVSEKTCNHPIEYIQKISGTQIREMLSKGKRPSDVFMRIEVSDSIIKLEDRKFIK